MRGVEDALDVQRREDNLSLVHVVEDALELVRFYFPYRQARMISGSDRRPEVLRADDQDDPVTGEGSSLDRTGLDGEVTVLASAQASDVTGHDAGMLVRLKLFLKDRLFKAAGCI